MINYRHTNGARFWNTPIYIILDDYLESSLESCSLCKILVYWHVICILSTFIIGYDDERGDYIVHQHDHLQYRYEIMEILGQGSFGQVVRARDHKKNEWVAIKIIRNKKRFHTQALVEVKILENLRKWVSILISEILFKAYSIRILEMSIMW